MQTLFLETHIDARFIQKVHEIMLSVLPPSDEEIHPVWFKLNDSFWRDASSDHSLRSIAATLLSENAIAQFLHKAVQTPVYICTGSDTSVDVLLALAEEVESVTGQFPTFLGVHCDPVTDQVSRADLSNLPHHLRFMKGDVVVLRLDVWASREERDDGEIPESPRGTRIRIRDRVALGKGPEYFAGTFIEDMGPDLPVPVIVPWALVMPLAEWQTNPPDLKEEGAWTALSCPALNPYYSSLSWIIKIDERPPQSEVTGLRALPFFLGYTVDARLREFRRPSLTEFISFDSSTGQFLLLKMYTQRISTASVPFDSDAGKAFTEALAAARSHPNDEVLL